MQTFSPRLDLIRTSPRLLPGDTLQRDAVLIRTQLSDPVSPPCLDISESFPAQNADRIIYQTE